MTKNGERIGNGPVNNVVSTLQRIGESLGLTHHHVCSCNEQAEKISNSLNVSMKDSSYTFGLKQSWTHSWVEGRVAHPSPPSISGIVCLPLNQGCPAPCAFCKGRVRTALNLPVFLTPSS